jgi:hypothetical protein
MRVAPSALHMLLIIGLALPAEAIGQWEITGKAGLPAVPYWVTARHDLGIDQVPVRLDLIPLLWFNDVDGNSSGCCVLGAAARAHVGTATLWFGLGFGTDAKAGAPAAIEAAAEVNGGAVAFRKLHGRIGFSALYPITYPSEPGSLEVDRVSLGFQTVWLDDARYLETVTFFECPEAPAPPCAEVETAYTWSEGRDNSILAEAAWGRGDWSQPRLRGSAIAGLKLGIGEHEYLRVELEALVADRLDFAHLDARFAAGWASNAAPQQRRFLLEGADPITRWLNPYIEAREALFNDIPYYVPGGPDLRVYEETRPLVKRYVAASGQLSRATGTEDGLWGRLAAYLAAAWTPGIPDRMGPEEMNEGGDLLFDWRKLPEGEGEEQGQFRARSLEVSEIWADAGLQITGGYRLVAVTLSLPLWASQPAFAGESIFGGKKSAFGLRWALSVTFFPRGHPGV